MTGKKWFAWVVALAVALPFAAAAEDAPGVFKIPGTDSTLKIYGFARMDIAYGLNRNNGYPLDVTVIPMNEIGGVSVPGGDPNITKWTVQWSRFGFSTTTPSAAGAIGMRIEGDFNGIGDINDVDNNKLASTEGAFRLRHAYGTIGDFLVIGKTTSIWADGAAGGETVDFNGYQTSGGSRREMVAVKFAAGDAKLALAVERPDNDVSGGGGKLTQIPNILGSVVIPMSWGHLSLRAVGVPLKTQQKSGFGYAASIGGHVEFSGDTLAFEVMAGSGAPLYLDYLGNQGLGSVVSGAVGSEEINSWQAVTYSLGFTHVWTPTLRSNLVWSHGITKNDQKLRPAAFNPDNDPAQRVYQVFGNVIYTVAKNCEIGAEYTWGQKVDFFDNKGTLSVINLMASYNFY